MLQTGTVIAGRYEVVDTVGAGGMSVVYKALDQRLNRYVAMKILKEEYSNDKTFVTKFRVEAQSAAGLSHPNIVNVYDVGDDEGIHYIVMELVEGITLKEYIQKKGHLAVSEAVNFSLQIAAAMEVAHENHIIHRDIKPQNIIVAPSGILKVTDFGIAKAATSATVSSNAIGSVHYISPEQARGGFSDERSDIYSLGITMYEMVTGRVPFEGDNNVTVALMHIQSEMIPPREYYPDILPSFEKVIAKCTQKKPERRYLTANALIADLRRVESDPSGNFVKLTTLLDDAPTRMMGKDELGQIKDRAKKAPYPQEEQAPVQKPAEKEIEQPKEEEEEKMDPKLEKLAVVLGVVAAILVVLLICFFIGKAMGMFGTTKKSKKENDTTKVEATTEADEDTTDEEKADGIEVPKVVDLSLEDAQKMLEASDLQYETEYEESDSVSSNKIIRQSPVAGDSVQKGDTVKLVVSSGSAAITVPNVSNYTEDKAKKTLNEEGFTPKVVYDYDDEIPKGNVIKQTPTGNSKAAKGSTVTITVSQGKKVKEIKMIKLIGLSLEQAKAKLKALGLPDPKVTKAASDAFDKGEVIAQSYQAGAKITSDTVVELTVCDGTQQTKKKYIATLDMDDVLDEDVDSAEMNLVLTQSDGSSQSIFKGTVTHDFFPYSRKIEGTKAGNGTVTVYLDGAKTAYSYTVTFVAVSE